MLFRSRSETRGRVDDAAGERAVRGVLRQLHLRLGDARHIPRSRAGEVQHGRLTMSIGTTGYQIARSRSIVWARATHSFPTPDTRIATAPGPPSRPSRTARPPVSTCLIPPLTRSPHQV